MRFYENEFKRLYETHKAIRLGKYPNCKELAEELGFSPKTMYRTIRFLKESLDAPIVYDDLHKGYYYTDPDWGLPFLDVGEFELFLLLIAVQMAGQLKGTSLAHNLNVIYTKLRGALSKKPGEDTSRLSDKLVSFHTNPTRQVSEKVWALVLDALEGQRVVRMQYVKPGAKAAERRKVEPVHLACVDGEWYFIAYCQERKAIRHFAVSRIKSLEITKETFEPRKFDPEKYFKNRFHRYVGGTEKSYEIVIRFSKEAVRWVEERVWHPQQTIRRLKDGGVKLTFPAPALYEVKRWVLEWGRDAEVLEPKELREEVAAEVNALSKLYSK